MNNSIIPCVLCDAPATFTVQPDGGTLKHLCDIHFGDFEQDIKSDCIATYFDSEGREVETIQEYDCNICGKTEYMCSCGQGEE